MRETQYTINKWQDDKFPDATLAGVTRHLSEEFQEFLSINAHNDPKSAQQEAADIVILLYAWADKVNCDLHAEIDRKMQINRRREWNIQEDGTGRHR